MSSSQRLNKNIRITLFFYCSPHSYCLVLLFFLRRLSLLTLNIYDLSFRAVSALWHVLYCLSWRTCSVSRSKHSTYPVLSTVLNAWSLKRYCEIVFVIGLFFFVSEETEAKVG